MRAVMTAKVDGTATGETPLLPRRQRVVLWVAVVSALLSTTGLVASSFVKSPQQVLADSAPPEAAPVTAPVERRVLASTLVTRGTVVAATSMEVTPVVAGAGAQVVTAVHVKPGDEVTGGQVLVAVSGRPLIALPGEVPAYRDLKPGDSGPDVEQLRATLSALGFPTKGDKAGYFGARTKAAVRGLYARIGYDAADTGGPGGRADRQALAAAAAAVDAARSAVQAMQRRIAAGETAPPNELPLPDQLNQLKAALSAAQRAEAELIATTGTMLPLSEFVFVPSFPARVTAFSAKVGDAVRAPLITLSAGQLGVRAKLRPDQAGLVKPGMRVKLTSETLGQDAEGTVTSVGELTSDVEQNQTGGATRSPPYHPATVTPSTALPAQWADLDVRVSITSARTETPVLVVPLSAVSAGADGRTTVSVVGSDGRLTRVEVRAGVSGDGFVEVTPVGGDLHEGDRVMVSAQS